MRHPRYGYRRITKFLRRDGFEINPKRVARIRREEGLKVIKRQKRITTLNRASETCAPFEYLFFIADQGLIPHQHPVNYIRPSEIPDS